MKLLVVLLYLGFALVSGDETTTLPESDDSDNIISNGYAVQEGRMPYLVTLVLEPGAANANTLCGGAIIANNWVLTAAQCLSRNYVDIHYGSIYKASGRIVYRVSRADFYIRPEYYSQKGFDIGLIRTPHVDFSFWINKVNLPNSCYDRFDNKWAVACGWGEKANAQLSNELQCVDLEILNNNACSHYYGVLNAGQMCARGNGNNSPCPGDSGGPLVTYGNPQVVGITSFFVQDGCRAGYPAGFTSVATHLNWIRSTMQSNVRYY